jgi:O-succinylbenzoic acid--CoA ligase
MNQYFIWQGKKYAKLGLVSFLETQLSHSPPEFEREIFSFALEWLNEKQQYFTVKTSGSTGAPKEIQLERQQMRQSAQATGAFLDLQPGDSCLLVLPAGFIAGKMMIVRALELGLDFYYLEPKINILSQIQRNYDFVAVIPPQVEFLIRQNELEQLNRFKKVIVGGASLSESGKSQLEPLQACFYATYGMTETITHIAMQALNGPEKLELFQCLPGVRVELNAQGCLVILGDRLPEKRLETSDLAQLDSFGRFRILGRTDHVINSGGLKISPEIWEEKLKRELPFEVMLSYINHDFLGQKLVLLVETKETPETTETLQILINQLFSPKYSPKHIVYLPSFFRTFNGKPDRLACQKWLQINVKES